MCQHLFLTFENFSWLRAITPSLGWKVKMEPKSASRRLSRYKMYSLRVQIHKRPALCLLLLEPAKHGGQISRQHFVLDRSGEEIGFFVQYFKLKLTFRCCVVVPPFARGHHWQKILFKSAEEWQSRLCWASELLWGADIGLHNIQQMMLMCPACHQARENYWPQCTSQFGGHRATLVTRNS